MRVLTVLCGLDLSFVVPCLAVVVDIGKLCLARGVAVWESFGLEVLFNGPLMNCGGFGGRL